MMMINEFNTDFCKASLNTLLTTLFYKVLFNFIRPYVCLSVIKYYKLNITHLRRSRDRVKHDSHYTVPSLGRGPDRTRPGRPGRVTV